MCLWLFWGGFSPSGSFLRYSQIKLQFKPQYVLWLFTFSSLSSCQFLCYSLVLFSTIGLKVQWELTKPLFMLIHDFFGPAPILVHWFRSWSRATTTPTIVIETKLSPPEYLEKFPRCCCQAYFVMLTDNSLLQMCAEIPWHMTQSSLFDPYYNFIMLSTAVFLHLLESVTG